MKKEDAIKYLQQLYPNGGHCWLDEQRIEAIGIAINALQEEPVSEELEEAAEQDVCEVVNNCSSTGIPNDHIPSWVQDAMVNEFIHGAKWQKEQMMAKAIDAHCFGFQGAALFSFRLPADNYLVGSEVKVIVIKED